MAILSKGRKADKFEPHNSLKLSFTNIRGPCSNFLDSESSLESNSPDILALCETNLDDSSDFGNFSVSGYLPLIQGNSTTHVYGLVVHVKIGLPFARDLPLENFASATASEFCDWVQVGTVYISLIVSIKFLLIHVIFVIRRVFVFKYYFNL